MKASSEESHPIEAAIAALPGGLPALAQLLGVSYVAIRKWQERGRLPRTEWTGETQYAARIAAAVPTVSKARLLGPWPQWEPRARRSAAEQAATESV